MTELFKDNALAKAFPGARTQPFGRGASGKTVVAVQYALGRLGHLNDVCDGKFGPLTEKAVKSFQEVNGGMALSGKVDNVMLVALDKAVSALDLRTPAAKAADPMAWLSDFRALRLPKIDVESSAETFTWDDAVIQQAYGRFVAPYWEVMKENRVEGDCKNLALFFMDQFRKQLKEDEYIDLPHPILWSPNQEKKWIVATSDKTRGLFSHIDELYDNNRQRVGRPEYQPVKNIQALDADHSMLYGVNVHYPGIAAWQVARDAKRVFDWDVSYSNRGDHSKPEVPVNKLVPGHLIFIDHTGDGRYDHTVNVIAVDKDDQGRTRRLVMAVGSYDDVRDNSAATVANEFAIVNPYAEEVVVELDAEGRIVKSEVTYSSEPSYVVKTRYSAATTLMERKSGGKLFVARWG